MYLQLWDAASGKCVATLVGHKEEVLDVSFDLSGQFIATASSDGELIVILFFWCHKSSTSQYPGSLSVYTIDCVFLCQVLDECSVQPHISAS